MTLKILQKMTLEKNYSVIVHKRIHLIAFDEI